MALAGDLSREKQRPKVMAIIGIAIGFSFYVALLLGPTIANVYGLKGIFLATGVLAIVCIFLVLWVVPNATHVAPKGDTLPVIKDIKVLLAHPQLIRLDMSVLILHMLITLLFVHMPKFFVALNWPLSLHWQLYLVVLLVSIVGLSLMMAAGRKINQVSLLMTSVFGLGLVFALLSFEHNSLLWLLILVSLFFTCFNYLEANFPALVSNIAPAGKKGSAMGIYASCQFFGAFLGGLLSSMISKYFGTPWVFGLAAVLCVLWLYLIKGLHSTQRLKRYTLKATSQNAEHMPNEGVIYIKVDGQKFNIQRARESLNLEE
jgi:MFS family permease